MVIVIIMVIILVHFVSIICSMVFVYLYTVPVLIGMFDSLDRWGFGLLATNGRFEDYCRALFFWSARERVTHYDRGRGLGGACWNIFCLIVFFSVSYDGQYGVTISHYSGDPEHYYGRSADFVSSTATEIIDGTVAHSHGTYD